MHIQRRCTVHGAVFHHNTAAVGVTDIIVDIDAAGTAPVKVNVLSRGVGGRIHRTAQVHTTAVICGVAVDIQLFCVATGDRAVIHIHAATLGTRRVIVHIYKTVEVKSTACQIDAATAGRRCVVATCEPAHSLDCSACNIDTATVCSLIACVTCANIQGRIGSDAQRPALQVDTAALLGCRITPDINNFFRIKCTAAANINTAAIDCSVFIKMAKIGVVSDISDHVNATAQSFANIRFVVVNSGLAVDCVAIGSVPGFDHAITVQ